MARAGRAALGWRRFYRRTVASPISRPARDIRHFRGAGLRRKMRPQVKSRRGGFLL
jgi:hypothetical protein